MPSARSPFESEWPVAQASVRIAINNVHSLAAAGPDRAALRLGYPQFEVRKPERWTEFCRAMLGLPAPVANPDGSLGFAWTEPCSA